MNAYLFFDWRARPLSVGGAPMPGAVLKFFESGTLTPAPVFADVGLVTPLGTEVEADDDGHFRAIYLSPSITYRAQLYDADGILQPDGDVDPLAPPRDDPPRTVVMFLGTPVQRDAAYPPALWQVMDGTNGTVDMRDRFPIAAGGDYDSGDVGGSVGAGLTGPAGAHNHGGNTGDVTLDASNLPNHTHRLFVWETGGQGNAEPFGTGSNAHGIAGDNDHSFPGSYAYRANTADGNPLTEAAGGTGSPAAHHHTVTAAVDHQHALAGGLPPYLALWFLMRRIP